MTDAVLNSTRPLNLTVTNGGSRKRKNSAPKQLAVQSALLSPDLLQQPSQHPSPPSISACRPNAKLQPSPISEEGTTSPLPLPAHHEALGPPFIPVTTLSLPPQFVCAPSDLSSLYTSLAADPTLCGPFITPQASATCLFTQPHVDSSAAGSVSSTGGGGYLDEVHTDNNSMCDVTPLNTDGSAIGGASTGSGDSVKLTRMSTSQRRRLSAGANRKRGTETRRDILHS